MTTNLDAESQRLKADDEEPTPVVLVVQNKTSDNANEEEDNTEVKTADGFCSKIPVPGLLSALVSGVVFCMAALCVKLLKDISIMEVVICRSLIHLIASIPVMAYKRSSFLGVPKERVFLLLRALMATGTISLGYYSLRFISLSDSSAIMFSAPALVSIFACAMLKEKCGVFQVAMVFMTVSGVFLISKPSFLFGSDDSSYIRVEGILLASAAALFHALDHICMRRLRKTHPSVTLYAFSVIAIIISVVVIAATGTFQLPTSASEILLLLGNGICSTGAQYFLILALNLEEAGPVSIARTIEVPTAFLMQAIIIGGVPEWTSILGALLNCSGVVMMSIRKWSSDNPERFHRLWKKIMGCFRSKPRSSHSVIKSVTGEDIPL